MKTNYFQGNSSHLQHISVGAVLMNHKGEVCVHHFSGQHLDGLEANCGLHDLFVLMRETIEPNETLEHALHRGIKEEFGAKGKLIDYIGSIQSQFWAQKKNVQKTTLYFLVRLVRQDISKRNNGIDAEDRSSIEWHDLEKLIKIMKKQGGIFKSKLKRTDLDESSILERLKKI